MHTKNWRHPKVPVAKMCDNQDLLEESSFLGLNQDQGAQQMFISNIINNNEEGEDMPEVEDLRTTFKKREGSSLRRTARFHDSRNNKQTQDRSEQSASSDVLDSKNQGVQTKLGYDFGESQQDYSEVQACENNMDATNDVSDKKETLGIQNSKIGVLDLTRSKSETRRWTDTSSRASVDRSSAAYDSNNNNQAQKTIVNLKDVKNKTPEELLNLAESLKIEHPSYLQKHDLVFTILKVLADQGAVIVGDGMLEILQDGYGFLRSSEANYVPGPDDIYVSPIQIKKFALRTGDTIIGPIRAPKKGERYFALTNIHILTGLEISKNRHRVHFDDLTPIYPMKQIKLETDSQTKDLSCRIIDIVAPLGMGQRAIIVAPPRTGKTILMQNISHSISTNYPEISLIVLLIGERPEEVTDMSRSVRGEVVSSTFDEPSYRHVQLAEMVIEKAKRMVECKKDVVILLDSITRLARAYNDVVPSSGKVLSGGVDSNALQKPKRLFGAARNTEEGGSLTIIATALIETGSRMDEVIFEEFKGTGNLEIVLDRKISDKRIFPAIDITKSGTRKEDLLVDRSILSKMWVLRRVMNPMVATESIEFLNDKLRYHKNNHDFFEQMNMQK